jgi:hypothetical protein
LKFGACWYPFKVDRKQVGSRFGGCLEQNMSRLTSCSVQVRRRCEAFCEGLGAEKDIMGAGKAKVVQIGNPMEPHGRSPFCNKV